VIAHRLSTVMDADQILVIEAGRIIERGAHRRTAGAQRRLRADVGLQQQEESQQSRERAIA